MSAEDAISQRKKALGPYESPEYFSGNTEVRNWHYNIANGLSGISGMLRNRLDDRSYTASYPVLLELDRLTRLLYDAAYEA